MADEPYKGWPVLLTGDDARRVKAIPPAAMTVARTPDYAAPPPEEVAASIEAQPEPAEAEIEALTQESEAMPPVDEPVVHPEPDPEPIKEVPEAKVPLTTPRRRRTKQ